MVKLTEEMLANKAERSRTVRDAYEQAGQQDRGPRVDWGVVTLQSIEAMRSDATLLRHYRSQGMSNEQVLAEVGQNDSDDRRIVLSRITSLIHKEAGTSCFKAGDFSGAIVEYEAALRALVGPNAVFPSRKYFDDQYMTGIRWRTGGSSFDTPGAAQETVTADVPLFIDLIALAGNIAQCYVRLGKYLEAIDWTQETEVIMNVARIHLSYDVWVAWRYPFPNVQEFWNIRLKHYKRCIDIFLALGNTATAAAYTLTLTGENSTLPDETTKPFPALHKLRHDVMNPDVFMRRHPEPNVSEAKVLHPDLQVLGVWERQQYASGSQKPGGRLYSSVWIWKGSMYVAGGTATPAHNERDIVGLTDTWCLNLENMTWRRLPDIPIDKVRRRGLIFPYLGPMQVWKDKAYLFAGSPNLAVFDLVSETWEIMPTNILGGKPWPYYENGCMLSGFGTGIIDGVLYVFGGADQRHPLGINVLMALKLETRCWRHISGTSEQVNVHFEPNMRNHPAVWAVPSQRKLFVLHGEAERSKAYLHKQKHGDKVDYHYTELWSFNVDEEKWEREKLRGNAVSSRAEMAAFYSPELGRTLVYGGYHGGMFTMDPQSEKDTGQGFQFAYLGDTFLFDPTTGIWQHVLVKGFPSYRLGARFVVNPEDGKVYLFGGSCNSNFVPSKTAVMRTYNDLWQLKIDMPGGHWDPKDLERDTRMERIGPWTRCYACGSCGIDLQKCGGTCGGKVYFCSRDCQKESWKEHKTKHGCRKV